MEAKIGIYDSHRLALEAVEVLTNKGYPETRLSIIGQADIVDNNIRIISSEPRKNAAMFIGLALGTTLGILSGTNTFVFPGLGFIAGSGGLIGGLAGFDIGLVVGGVVSLVITFLIKKDKFVKYKEHLKEGKFIVFAQGTEEEIKKAKIILCNCGTNLELCFHE